jgi:hypothetical protein
MEYLILLTLVIPALLSYKILHKAKTFSNIPKLQISQARSLKLFGDMLEAEILAHEAKSKIKTQSTDHFDRSHVRILFYGERAYWINNNQVFYADIINGEVDKETTNQVDTMTMDDVQLKEMIFIIEKLTEGLNNEDRNSGD